MKLNTKITGNVKSKHKQYDHWHSQDLSTLGGPKRGSEATEWGNGGGIFCTLILFLFSLSNQWGAWALVPPYSYASDSGVARIC